MEGCQQELIKTNVRQQASDKENIRKKPNSGHINPNKKIE